jgi:hypothetical protein
MTLTELRYRHVEQVFEHEDRFYVLGTTVRGTRIWSSTYIMPDRVRNFDDVLARYGLRSVRPRYWYPSRSERPPGDRLNQLALGIDLGFVGLTQPLIWQWTGADLVISEGKKIL